MLVQPRRRRGARLVDGVAGAATKVLRLRVQAAVRVVVGGGGPQALDGAPHHRARGPKLGPAVPIQPSLTFAAERVTLCMAKRAPAATRPCLPLCRRRRSPPGLADCEPRVSGWQPNCARSALHPLSSAGLPNALAFLQTLTDAFRFFLQLNCGFLYGFSF